MKKIFTLLAIASLSSVFSQITMIGNFPSSMRAGSSIETDIKINKGAVGNFAKYQMDVPTGITVSAIDANGGNFTFENKRVKIVWVSVPSDAEFTIKLKLNVSADAPSSANLSQKFYYLDNNEKKEVEAKPVMITINGGTDESLTAAVSTNVTPVETKPIAPVTSAPAQAKLVEPVAATEIKPNEAVQTPKTASSSEPVHAPKTAATTSDDGMTYKVQIGAYPTAPNKTKYAGLPNLSIDMSKGMYKVTVGQFNVKEDAIKYCDELKTKGYSGFVAKYKDGTRVN